MGQLSALSLLSQPPIADLSRGLTGFLLFLAILRLIPPGIELSSSLSVDVTKV